MNDKQRYLFNRLVLAHCWLWIQKHIDDEDKLYTPDFAYRLKTAGYNSRAIHGFHSEEIDLLDELGKEPEFEKITKGEISLLVMALELAKIWAEDIPKDQRPNINISDKKLLVGKKHYVMELLNMRVKGAKNYDDQKAIVEDTALHSKIWYNYVNKYIKENYHG